MSDAGNKDLLVELACALLAKHATDEARRAQQAEASRTGLNGAAPVFLPNQPPPAIDVTRYTMGSIQATPPPLPPTLPPLSQEKCREQVASVLSPFCTNAIEVFPDRTGPNRLASF